MIVSIVSVISLLSGLASAMPFGQVVRTLPPDITHIAHDQANGRYHAYKRDGSLYGTYSAEAARDIHKTKRDGACPQLSTNDLQGLPGFQQIDQYASKNWGTGSHKVVTNDPDEADSPAFACVSSDVVNVKLDGSPSCTNSSDSTAGELVGTNGTVTLSFQQGESDSGSWTVTQESSLAISVTASAKIGIPEVAEVTTGVTVESTFTNSQSSTFSTTSSNLVTNTLSLTSSAGKTCSAAFDSRTCTTKGSGEIPIIATGWVWYEYDDQTNGHYKWAVSIDTVVTDVSQRSSTVKFTGSLSSQSKANYSGHCE